MEKVRRHHYKERLKIKILNVSLLSLLPFPQARGGEVGRGFCIKTARKMAQVKERGGGGEERKETLADKPRDFENHPLGLSCLSSRTDI